MLDHLTWFLFDAPQWQRTTVGVILWAVLSALMVYLIAVRPQRRRKPEQPPRWD